MPKRLVSHEVQTVGDNERSFCAFHFSEHNTAAPTTKLHFIDSDDDQETYWFIQLGCVVNKRSAIGYSFCVMKHKNEDIDEANSSDRDVVERVCIAFSMTRCLEPNQFCIYRETRGTTTSIQKIAAFEVFRLFYFDFTVPVDLEREMMERTKYFKAAKMDYREELLYPINQPKAIGDSHPEKKCSPAYVKATYNQWAVRHGLRQTNATSVRVVGRGVIPLTELNKTKASDFKSPPPAAAVTCTPAPVASKNRQNTSAPKKAGQCNKPKVARSNRSTLGPKVIPLPPKQSVLKIIDVSSTRNDSK